MLLLVAGMMKLLGWKFDSAAPFAAVAVSFLCWSCLLMVPLAWLFVVRMGWIVKTEIVLVMLTKVM